VFALGSIISPPMGWFRTVWKRVLPAAARMYEYVGCFGSTADVEFRMVARRAERRASYVNPII
jgi:hypothetical protein